MVSKRGAQCSGKIWEIMRRGDKNDMFTTITIKRGVGGCKIDSKALYKMIGNGVYDLPSPTFYRVSPILNMSPFIILKSQSPYYIFKNAPWEGGNIRTT